MAKRTDPAFVTKAEKGTGLHLWLRLAIILLAGLFASFGCYKLASNTYRDNMQARASTIASLLDAQKVDSLKTPSTANFQANYDYLKTKLAQSKAAMGSTRFVYLMAEKPSKGVYFLVDSEVKGSDGFSPNGQEYPEASQQLQASFAGGQAFVEGPVRDRWGTWLSALSPVRGSDGMPVAVLGFDVPASSYIRLMTIAGGAPLLVAGLAAGVVFTTESLRHRRQEALRMRSELVSIASHELRSPLSGLRWSQELMMSYPLDERAKKSLKLMHNSTIKLQESIEDVLQIANLQSGSKHPLDLTDVNLTTLIDDVFSVQQPLATEKSVTLERRKGWPAEVLLHIDERRMKRVFNNLVSNAVKYSSENSTVLLTYEPIPSGHLITVNDHGIGIPRNDQAKVFTGFYRADNARKASVNGTGMGLYLSRAIVEQHGGKLWLESSEQTGTTIYMSLPTLAVKPVESESAKPA